MFDSFLIKRHKLYFIFKDTLVENGTKVQHFLQVCDEYQAEPM